MKAANNPGLLSTLQVVFVRDTLDAAASLRLHWPEYLMEAGEMSLFMFSTARSPHYCSTRRLRSGILSSAASSAVR